MLAILSVVVLYGLMILVLRNIDLEAVQKFIAQSGMWAPVIFTLIGAAGLIIAPLSGSSVFITGGILFGKEVAFLLSFIATILGCSANFWISRKFGRQVASRFIGKSHLDELDKFTKRLNSHRGILYMVLIMPLAQDIVSYAVGLTKVTYWRFLIALILSGAIIVAAYIYLGSSFIERLI